MKTKIIASSLAGLAILGGTVGFAVSGASSAGAATVAAQNTVTQDAPAGHGLGHAHRKALRRAALVAAAKAINITPEALRTDLKNGQTISQVATANGADPKVVASTLVKDIDTRLNTLVSNGKLAQDKATKIEAKVPAAVDKAMNKVFGQHKPAS